MSSKLIAFSILMTFVPILANGLACVSNFCENGGSCQDNVQWYLCHCVDGYIGRHCEKTGSGALISEPPSIANCSSDLSKATSSPYEMVDWINPSPLNPENVYLVFQSHFAESSFFPVGETAVHYIFADDLANIANCSFKITIYLASDVTSGDVTPPDITYCPMDIYRVLPINGSDEIEVFWEEPRAEDNGGLVTITRQSAFPNQTFRVNTQTTILYEFSDEAGNSATCSFTVVVKEGDNKPPEIQGCPANIMVTIGNQFSSSLVSWDEPTVMEDYVKVERSHNSGSLFTLGDTLVTYNFTDLEGLSALCTFAVTIIHEASPLEITCPEDIITVVDGDQGFAEVMWQEPLLLVANVSLASTYLSGSQFPVGITTVTYAVFDGLGNREECSFTVEVEQVPSFVCPENITIEIGADEEGTYPAWDEPTISETGFFLVGSRLSGDFVGAGVTVITYSLYSDERLISECSFYVNIVQVKDLTPPQVFNCPSLGVSKPLAPGDTNGSVFWPVPMAEDDSGPAFLTSQTAFPGDIFEAGQTPVTYTFEDSSGNVAVCTFIVTVIITDDTSPPVISGCPANITVHVFRDSPNPTVQWTIPSATDDVSFVNLVSETHRPGDVFPRGVSLITYIFVDEANNFAVCSFGVNVTEIEKPYIVNCPSTISVDIEEGLDGTEVIWQEPYVNTDLDLQDIRRSHVPGSRFPLGQTKVTYCFTFDEVPDFKLNCTFFINVMKVNVIPPRVIYCPGDIKKLINDPLALPSISWLEPVVMDDSGNVSTSLQSHHSGTIFPEGTTDVLYQFMDESRNVAECRFRVTVQFMKADLIIPVTFDIEEEFTADLLVTNSSAYTSMVERLRNGVSGVVMSRRQLRSTFGGLNVVQLRPGSIIAETDLWFHSMIPVDDVISYIDNQFRNTLRNSVGFLGDLRINSIDIGVPVKGATTAAPVTSALPSTSTKGSSTTLSTSTTISTTQITDEENEVTTLIQTTGDTLKTKRKETPREQESQTAEPAINFLAIVILTPVVASIVLLLVSILIFACRVCYKEERTARLKSTSALHRETTDHPLGMVTEPIAESSSDTAERDAREEEERFININRLSEITDGDADREDVHSEEDGKESKDTDSDQIHHV